MYVPGWLYELKPIIYAALAIVGFDHLVLQPLGAFSAYLLWLAAARMCYMRFVYRKEHRGCYWHRPESRRLNVATTML